MKYNFEWNIIVKVSQYNRTTNRELIVDRLKGYSISKLSEKYGISRQAVYNHINKFVLKIG